MRKRLLLSAVALVALACAVLLVLAMLPPRPGVTKANFERIEVGMTKADAESLVWTGRERKLVSIDIDDVRYIGADGALVWIHFKNGKVAAKRWVDPEDAPEASVTERIRRWLGLP